jgi:hypothetical protein
MGSVIFDWLYKYTPILVLILILAFRVWHVARAYFTRFKPMEEDIKNLKSKSNCTRHESDIADLKSMVRNIERILLKGDNTLMPK